MIGVAGAGKGAQIVDSTKVIGGIIACGIFLLILALVGLYGTLKHHQVMLFFVSLYLQNSAN